MILEWYQLYTILGKTEKIVKSFAVISGSDDEPLSEKGSFILHIVSPAPKKKKKQTYVSFLLSGLPPTTPHMYSTSNSSLKTESSTLYFLTVLNTTMIRCDFFPSLTQCIQSLLQLWHLFFIVSYYEICPSILDGL